MNFDKRPHPEKMTKFFNKFKKSFFFFFWGAIFQIFGAKIFFKKIQKIFFFFFFFGGPFSSFLEQKLFFKKSGSDTYIFIQVSNTMPNLQKTRNSITTNVWTDGRMDKRTDRSYFIGSFRLKQLKQQRCIMRNA